MGDPFKRTIIKMYKTGEKLNFWANLEYAVYNPLKCKHRQEI